MCRYALFGEESVIRPRVLIWYAFLPYRAVSIAALRYSERRSLSSEIRGIDVRDARSCCLIGTETGPVARQVEATGRTSGCPLIYGESAAACQTDSSWLDHSAQPCAMRPAPTRIAPASRVKS